MTRWLLLSGAALSCWGCFGFIPTLSCGATAFTPRPLRPLIPSRRAAEQSPGASVELRRRSRPRRHPRSRPPSRRDGREDDTNEEEISVQPLYLSLAAAETIFWYYLAPGIDPSSRWFAPSDAAFISEQLLNPAVVLHPPPGSGIGFSSLLLNSFLILPAVWSLLLLQEDGAFTPGKRQALPPWPFCLAGFLVGGGSLIPYMIVRRARGDAGDVDPSSFPPAYVRAFEGRDPAGPKILAALLSIVLATFLYPFVSGTSDWGVEWTAFLDRAQSSQFTSLALLDFTMISVTILDPISDDARRRGYLDEDALTEVAALRLVPFLLPLAGPVAWICFRPKYGLVD